MKNATLRIAIGADHGGIEVKSAIIEALDTTGNQVVDYGTTSKDSVDYPDYANAVAQSVASGKADFGVLICKSGIGMSIAANRIRGVRAARLCSVEDATITREHNDSNVACLGAREMSTEDAVSILKAFITTSFEGGRHVQRVAKASGSRLAISDPEVFAVIEAEGRRRLLVVARFDRSRWP